MCDETRLFFEREREKERISGGGVEVGKAVKMRRYNKRWGKNLEKKGDHKRDRIRK